MAVNVNNFPDLVADWPATISSGATASSVINCRGTSVASIVIPAGFTGTSIQFDVSLDGVTYGRLRDLDTNAVVSFTVTQTSPCTPYCIEDLSLFVGFPFLKIISGSSEGADRIIHVGLRRFV